MAIVIVLKVEVYLTHKIMIKHYESLCKHKYRAELKSAYQHQASDYLNISKKVVRPSRRFAYCSELKNYFFSI